MSSRAIVVRPEHPALAGHFPGLPILPGAVLLDEILWMLESDLSVNPRTWQLLSVKFLETVAPGTALTLSAAREGDRIHFTVSCGTRPAMSGALARVATGT